MEASTPATSKRTYLDGTPAVLDRGGRLCARAAREHFGKWLWAFRNLPKDQFQAVCGLAMLLKWAQTAASVNKNIPQTEAPCDQLREDLSDAFVGRYLSAELYYFSQMVDQFKIPKQFVFEVLEAFDRMWRFGQPASETEMLSTATRLGGALVRQLVHILGVEKPHFETAALKLGQGLTLTWWLANLADDVRGDQLHLAKSDFEACQLKTQKLLWPEPVKELNHFVRLYGHRIDQLLSAGSRLYQHLNYDGQRVLRTLMGIAWKALSNVRLDPQRLRETDGALTDKDLFALRARQFLGLDAPLPFGSDEPHAH